MSGFKGVFISRHGLQADEPKDGRLLDWEVGEKVQVSSGLDAGRTFVITSDRKSHDALLPDPEPYVREGYFKDDPTKTRWAKAEKILWILPLN